MSFKFSGFELNVGGMVYKDRANLHQGRSQRGYLRFTRNLKLET